MPMAIHTRIHTTMVYGRGPAPPIQHTTRAQPTSHHTIPKHKEDTKGHLTYMDYLKHTQTKDTKYIRPPLQITNLKTYMQECNPDKDITANKPTIQTQALESNIYDPNGNYMATITTDRQQWLWNQFTHNNSPQLTNFLQPPPRDFETEVLWLIQRYISILPKKKPKNIQPHNQHHPIHLDITKSLIKTI